VKADTESHLPEHRIIEIVSDDTAINRSEQTHLEQCDHCREVMVALEDDLDRLCQRATQSTPTPEKHFVLPADQPERHRISRQRWGWAAAGSVLSVALLAVYFWIGGVNRLPGLLPTTPPVANLEDPAMIKAHTLAENALPPAYLALSESIDGGYDQGFIDFLIPPLDDDSMS
jgi:hypothetical protein